MSREFIIQLKPAPQQPTYPKLFKPHIRANIRRKVKFSPTPYIPKKYLRKPRKMPNNRYLTSLSKQMYGLLSDYDLFDAGTCFLTRLTKTIPSCGGWITKIIENHDKVCDLVINLVNLLTTNKIQIPFNLKRPPNADHIMKKLLGLKRS